MKKNVKLKSALFEIGKTITKLAEETGIPRTYLSLACSGRLVLTAEEKSAIAKSLNRSTAELFD